MSAYQKIYLEVNKDKLKIQRKDQWESIRDPNTPRIGSKEYRIKLSCAQQGINHEDFAGFLTEQKYCRKFNNQLRKQIRNNYNNCDYISGIHKDICNNNKNLDVHHVDYNKQQGCEDHQWKLIPLSKSNHAKTNASRPFWNRLFTYSLQYEAEYYGDE